MTFILLPLCPPPSLPPNHPPSIPRIPSRLDTTWRSTGRRWGYAEKDVLEGHGSSSSSSWRAGNLVPVVKTQCVPQPPERAIKTFQPPLSTAPNLVLSPKRRATAGCAPKGRTKRRRRSACASCSRWVRSLAQHSTAQHSTAQHSTAQHSTAQHSTAQHSTAQHSTAQHSTASQL